MEIGKVSQCVSLAVRMSWEADLTFNNQLHMMLHLMCVVAEKARVVAGHSHCGFPCVNRLIGLFWV